MRDHTHRTFLAAALTSCLALPTLAAADDVIKHFDIAKQSLASALNEFARQSDRSILFSTETTGSKSTNGVKGDLPPEAALNALLKGTGLRFRTTADNTILVERTRPGGVTDATYSRDQRGPEGGLDSSSRLQLAQATQGVSGESRSVEKNKGFPSDSQAESTQVDEVTVTGLPEILVKGSRVFNVDVKRTEDDEQPYHILDSKQIQASGALNVEDFLKQRLTMNTVAISSNQSISSGGATSSINLRGLGANETLVLIDGRRSAGVTFGGPLGQPDLNAIPLSAIERIEVLPSSASAIYGGAAMGGVVNVILKKNYEGGQITYSHENTFEGHAPIDTVSATYGLTLEGGKTQVMLSGQYSDATLLRMRDRPEIAAQGYSAMLARDPVYFASGPARPYLGETPNIGSKDGHTGLTFKGSGIALGSPMATIASGALAANPSTVIPGQWNGEQPPTTQNYGLLQPLGPAPTVKSLMASLHRDFGAHLGFFTEFSTQSNSTSVPYNPIAGSFTVPASSPANPFNQDVRISIPNTTDAPFLTDSVTRSVTVGMLARLPAEWSSELDYTWSKNSFSDLDQTSYDATAFNAALANGTINPFLDTLAHPIDLTAYLAPTTFGGVSTLNDLGLRVSGPLWSLPAGRPTLTVGLEHRKEGSRDSDYYTTYGLTPSSNVDLRYFGQAQSTNSVYAEAKIPLVAPPSAIPLIHSVDLQLAGRSERYTVNARTPFAYLGPDGSVLTSMSPPQGVFQEIKYTSTNPTIGLKYKPIEDLALRASFAKAFLPPTADQFLPNPRNSGSIFITDPVNGQTYSVSATQGGNPNLRPQTARDWNFGFILEPRTQALKGLRINLEYYRVTQLDYITTPSPAEVLANSAYASRVTRDSSGLVKSIDLAYLNATQFSTAGWDLTIDYQKSTAIGTFDLHAIGSAIDYDKRQYTISGPLLDYAGFPSELGEAKLKGNATLSWSYRAWALAWTTTYFGSYKQGYGSADSPYALQHGVFRAYTDAQGAYSIPSQTYHDIVASYELRETPLPWVSGVRIQLGIKNLFNKIPPLDAFRRPYFYSSYGDARLRDYWLGVSASF